jgi:pimeloyl-ACP methyl ester carboxylesterase
VTYEEFERLRRRVDTRHGSFSYVDVGHGPVSLFVHGLFVSDFLWHGVVDALRAERRCVAYCLPYHGRSEVPPGQSLSLEAQAEMLDGFCDALELGEVDLVANDTGGAVAQALAVRNPARLRTLTLTNCEARDWMPSHDEFAQALKQLAAQGRLAPAFKAAYDDFDAVRQGAFASSLQWPDRLLDEEIHGLMYPHHSTLERATRLERFFLSLTPGQLVSLEPKLRELHTPTQLVWGTGDPIFPLPLAEWLCDTIPGCRGLVEIEGGKLFWPFERGDELVPHLRRHWREASRPTRLAGR